MVSTALVTGGNRGIGRHIAAQLAATGVRVWLGARDPVHGEETARELSAQGLTVRVVPLDVTDAGSVAAAATAIGDAGTGLDILVNNAGIAAGFDPPSAADPADLRRTYEVNVFGVVAVTNAMLPLLRRAPAGRIVNVTSELGAMSLITDPGAPWAHLLPLAYRSSKAALNAVTALYAAELAPAGITVVAVCPGLRATGFGGGTPPPGAGDPAEGAAGVVRQALAVGGPTGVLFGHDGVPMNW